MKAREVSRGGLETETAVTLSGTFYQRVETDREKVAFSTGKEIWTYGRLGIEVGRLARGLVERGVQPSDRVGLHMANLPELVMAYLACFEIGAIAAPLSIRL